MDSYTRVPSNILTIWETIKVPTNCILCTFDVTSLYTNISHQEGMQAVSEQLAIHIQNSAKPSNLDIIKLLKIVLENNNFDFMVCTSNKLEALLWVPHWHLPVPTYLCHHLRTNMYVPIPYRQCCGKGSLMIFFSYGPMD